MNFFVSTFERKMFLSSRATSVRREIEKEMYYSGAKNFKMDEPAYLKLIAMG